MSAKSKLFNHCQQLIKDKISDLEISIKQFQDAANEDAKSSMGDKYETNRAMMHLEKEKAASQLSQLVKMQQLLDSIKIDRRVDQVEIGSLVTTQNNTYFISIGLGPVSFEDNSFLVISAASPIGQQMMGSKVGESFSFRGLEDKIEEIQ